MDEGSAVMPKTSSQNPTTKIGDAGVTGKHSRKTRTIRATKRSWKPCPEDRAGAYFNYYSLEMQSGLKEPMTTHSDHYNTNFRMAVHLSGRGIHGAARLYRWGRSAEQGLLLGTHELMAVSNVQCQRPGSGCRRVEWHPSSTGHREY